MEIAYKLFFLTDTNKTASIKITNALETASPAEVKSAMDALTANGAAGNKQGVFVEGKKAQLIKTQTTEFVV